MEDKSYQTRSHVCQYPRRKAISKDPSKHRSKKPDRAREGKKMNGRAGDVVRILVHLA